MPARRGHSQPGRLIEWLSALSDTNRLRMLRALELEELSVGELARVIQLPQSTISRHLKQLLDARLVTKRSSGTSSMYRFADDSADAAAKAIWTTAREELERTHSFDNEQRRLAVVLAARHTDSRGFFGKIGGDWDRLRRELFGQSFTAEALLALVSPEWTIADIGCGTGEISELVAPVAAKVIAIDREPAMLQAARLRLARFKNLQFRAGDLLDLPLKDGEVDCAVVSLVMHHLDDPAKAVTGIARALTAKAGGGTLLIIDMMAHDRATYRHTMGHTHLGFSAAEVKGWARRAGLRDVRYLPARPDANAKGPGLFVATMRK